MLSLYFDIFREGCLLLYGPKPPTNQGGARSLKGDGKPLPTFEIAVHSSKYSTQSLSIFRTADKGIKYNQLLVIHKKQFDEMVFLFQHFR